VGQLVVHQRVEFAGGGGAGDSISAASSTVFVSGLGSYVFPSTTALVADARDWVANPGTNFGWL